LSENDEYEVGYRKPPKASRWRKGQSGNRRGRQKGARNLMTELIEELGEAISVKEQGVPRSITKQRAIPASHSLIAGTLMPWRISLSNAGSVIAND